MENKHKLAQLAGEKDYDSALCGSIPLHQINLIQPHGVLLVLDKHLRIVQVSENCEALLGIPLADLLEKDFTSFVPTKQVQDLQAELARQAEAGENSVP